MKAETKHFHIDKQKLKLAVDSHSWEDVDASPDGELPTNPCYNWQPAPKDLIYYRRFRYCLVKKEISQRSVALCSLLLTERTSNYYALMIRKQSKLSSKLNDEVIKSELEFVNCLLYLNPKEYQLWTYKKQLLTKYQLENKLGLNVYEQEQLFINQILKDDSKNYHVWDYYFQVTLLFNQIKQKINITQKQIFHHQSQTQGVYWPLCYSLWSFRFNLIKNYSVKLTGKQIQELQQQEFKIVTDWIVQENNAQNECGWNYLVGLVQEFSTLTQQQFNQAILICQKAINRNNKNQPAANALLNLFNLMVEKKESKQVLQQVRGKRESLIKNLLLTDPIRQAYYLYLLAN